MSEAPAGRTLERVIPFVKTAASVESLRASPSPPAFARHLVGDLWVVLGFDSPDPVQTVTAEDRARFGLPLERLEAVALTNLGTVAGEVNRRGAGVFRLHASGYEASLLVADELWEQLAAEVQGDLVACALTRDVVVFTGTEIPGGLQSIQGLATGSVLDDETMLLSRALIRWTGASWTPFVPAGE